MPIDILMPALSPTMEEGKLSKWLVKPGDSINSGDILAEIETDKATMEVEAVEDGTIGELRVDEGSEAVRVNSVIAVMLAEGEDRSALQGRSAEPPALAPKTDPETVPTAVSGHGSAALGEREEPNAAIHGAERSDVLQGNAPASDGAPIFASPLARRMAHANGIDLAMLTGSGPRQRIIKRDVEAALAHGVPQPTPRPPLAAPGVVDGADNADLALFDPDSYTLVAHDKMRLIVARRLTEAKRDIPHFYLKMDCQIDALLALRAEINAAAPTDEAGNRTYKISVNDMVIKAHALALKQVPNANVSWTDTAMVRHKHADIGVAVAVEGGLFTPIIRRADDKSLSVISGEMRELAARARARRLLPQEYQGGSSAISNLGMFGVDEFSAVINPPHATILAVGAGRPRPVVRDGELAEITVMTATLSTDHRAVDGALGAQLLAAFRSYIERPLQMLI